MFDSVEMWYQELIVDFTTFQSCKDYWLFELLKTKKMEDEEGVGDEEVLIKFNRLIILFN